MMGLGNVGGLGRLGYAAANSVGWWLSGAQLDLDFANDRSFNRKTGYQASPNGLLTYTSPSPKMVYGDDGVLGYARHNLLTYAEQFDNAAWTNIVAGTGTIPTKTANAGIAPDGTTTADRIVLRLNGGTTSSDAARLRQSYTTIVGTYTFSVWLKSYDGASSYAMAIQTGTSVQAITVTGEWQRFTVTATMTAAAQPNDIFVRGGQTPTQSDAADVLMWGAQLNRGSTALDYLATTSAAKYDLPIAHDPLTHAPLGVLIEEQRTNLLLRSEDCTTTWTDPIGPTTSTKVNIPSPFHDGIAFQITNTLNSGFSSGGLRQSVAVASSTQHFLSFYVEDNVGLITIALENSLAAYGASFNAQVDTATGVSSGVSAAQVTTVAVNGGWHVRANLGTSKSGGGLANVEIQMTVDGLGVPKILAAIQLEAGAFATSYIQTGSAQVTRAADQVSLATSAFNYNTTAFSIVALFDQYQLQSAVSTRTQVCYVSDAGLSRFALRGGDNGLGTIMVYGNGTTVYSLGPATAVAANTQMHTAAGADATGGAMYQDGSLAATSPTSVGTPNVATGTMSIGSAAALNALNGHIKRLTYWNSRKSNAELQALSA